MGQQGGLAHGLVLKVAEVGLAAAGEHLGQGHARAPQQQLVRIHKIIAKFCGQARAQRAFAAGHEAAERQGGGNGFHCQASFQHFVSTV